jgi:pimeloyl-ACP methyl ester carboxylesterase
MRLLQYVVHIKKKSGFCFKTALLVLSISFLGCTHLNYVYIFSKTSLVPPACKTITMSDGYVANYYVVNKGENNAENVVFFISGSGFNSLKYYIEDYFASLQGNYTIFALQKRFVKNNSTEVLHKPSADFYQWNYFDAIVADNISFIEQILSENKSKAKNIILFGVSEGGVVAAKIAAINKRISHLVVIGSGGMQFCDELKLLYATNNTKTEFDRAYSLIRDNSNSTDRFFLGHTFKYMASFLFIDPLDFYGKITIPILLAQGEMDKSTPIESGRMLDQYFKSLNRNNLSFIEFPGCDHTLKQGKKDFKPLFFNEMNDWLNK